MFLAACGILVLLFNVFLAFRCTRIATRLSHSNPSLHPRKAVVTQILRLGVIMGLIGMLFLILGGGASLGVLLAKSFARPQGSIVYTPQQMICTMDVLVAMANMNGITGHFVGILSALWLLDRLDRS
jgi:hypothetical protein